jgi:Transposase, Mutator family
VSGTLSGDVSSFASDIQTATSDLATEKQDTAGDNSSCGQTDTLAGDAQSVDGDLQSVQGDVQSITPDIATVRQDIATMKADLQKGPRKRPDSERARPGRYARNLATKVPKSAQPWVSTLVRTIFEQPDAASVRAQHHQVVTALEAKFPAAAAHLHDAREDILAFTAFPREIWRQVWSNNPQERLNKEIRRRTDVVGIFPSHDAILRLVGTVLAEQNDEWTEARLYMGPEVLAARRKAGKGIETPEKGVTIEAIGA